MTTKICYTGSAPAIYLTGYGERQRQAAFVDDPACYWELQDAEAASLVENNPANWATKATQRAADKAAAAEAEAAAAAEAPGGGVALVGESAPEAEAAAPEAAAEGEGDEAAPGKRRRAAKD